MIKCYHIRRIELIVNTTPQLFYEGPVIAPLIAEIDSNKEDLEDIWDCCNNSCWGYREDFRGMDNYRGRFKVKFTDSYDGYCNDDLLVHMGNEFMLSLSVGWKSFPSFEEALEYSKEHSQWVRLHHENYQHPTGKEHTLEELNEIKADYESKGIHCTIIHDAK